MSFAFVGTHTPARWAAWHRTNVAVSERGVTVATDPVPTYVSPSRLAEPQPFDAVDVAVDRCGIAYLLAASGDLYQYDPTQASLTRLACVWTSPGPGSGADDDSDEAGDADEAEPVGIAATDDSLFIADTAGRVQAISRHLLQTRWVTDGFVSPVGLVATSEGVYVLDAGTPQATDEAGEGGATGETADGTGDDSAGGRLVELLPGGESRTVVTGLPTPLDVAADTGDTLSVLCRTQDGPAVFLFAPVTFGDGAVTPDEPLVSPSEFRTRATGTPVVPSCLESVDAGELVVGVAPDAPGERTLFRYRAADGAFERLPSFTTSSLALQTGRPGPSGEPPDLYVVDGDRRVHLLDAARQSRRNDDTGRYDATLVGRFDAGEWGEAWHRVTMGIDPGDSRTQVRLQYAATDDEWQPDAGAAPTAALETAAGIDATDADHLRDAGVSTLGDLADREPGAIAAAFAAIGQSMSLSTAATLVERARDALRADVDTSRLGWRDLGHPNPEDALLDDAEGRFLWVRLELVGNEFSAPGVRRFRAYFPRQSYLRHLPGVYREDERSAAFLERYLSVFESTFVDIEEEIGRTNRYIDPTGIPAAHLPWLGEWLATEADDTWPTAARRELIAHAPALYKKRGTAEGLLAMIRLYLANSGATAADESESRRTRARDAVGRRPLPADATRFDIAALDSGTAAAGDSGPTAETGGSGSTAETGDSGSIAGDADSRADAPGDSGGETRDDSDGQRADDGGRELGDPIEADRQGTTGRKSVYLLEHSDLRCIDSPAVEALYTRLLSCPEGFLVLLRPGLDDEQVRTVERIVDAQQPAHATGRAVHLRPWLRLAGGETDEHPPTRGSHTYLGINTTLAERDFTVEEATLGQTTMLTEREATGQFDVKARLDRDARID